MVSVAWYAENQVLYVSINSHEVCKQPKQGYIFCSVWINEMIACSLKSITSILDQFEKDVCKF